MLHGLAYAFVALQSPIAAIDALAQKRDEAGMAKYASPALVNAKRFRFLVQNGVYETGRSGCPALPLKDPLTAKTYVVFSTKLTSEDIGEQVFEIKGGKLGRYIPEQDKLGFEIEHHDFDINFDLAEKQVRIIDSVRFRKLSGSGSSFLVRMSPQYQVGMIKDAAGRNVKFGQAGGTVLMTAPRTASRTFTYKFGYRAIVDMPNYAGSISNTEATLTNDYWYPMIARWPATYYARVFNPTGRNFDVTEWEVLAQGIADSDPARFRWVSYDMKLPVTYFSLTGGKFERGETKIGGRGYWVASPRMTQEQMLWQSEVNADVVEFYDKTFGKYPFGSWGTLESPHYGGGALEAYSYATYGLGWLPDLDAHEPAHTWWGGMINNTYLKSLWNESFAVYSSGLYDREGPIGAAAEKRLAFVSDAEPSGDYNLATCADSGAHIGGAAGSLGYGKGAKVLQMLEQEIGTDAMVRSMREWIKTHPKGVPGEWEDFEKVVARVTKKDTKWFFDQWLRLKGWADFNLDKASYRDGQVDAVISWNGPKYHLKTDVMLQFADGTRQFSKQRIGPTPDSEFSFISIATSRKPVLISIDPWRKLLRRYDRNETPIQLDRYVGRARYFVDPAKKDWLENVRGQPGRALSALPDDLDGLFIIGSPETLPIMRSLTEKAGFSVKGDKLTYDGTTINLNNGAALAVVDLGEGKRCAIGLGKIRLSARLGRSRLALVDGLGRFLRGQTEPKTSGFLTMKID